MFNKDKNKDLKDEVANLVDTAQENVTDIASDVQCKTSELFNESKKDVMELTHNLKALLTDVDYSGKAHEIKAQVMKKADEWKHLVSEEATKAMVAGTEKTRKAVREQPLLTLSLAAATGLLIGYLLGQKKTAK